MDTKIVNGDFIGMQVCGGPPARIRPKVLIFMGGLAIPNMLLTNEDVKELIQLQGNVTVIGVCFMSMFKKAGWLWKISFDMMIDATIDPVTVMWKES